MIRKGQWILLPADLVEHMQNLRLSPIGVVPQRDRRPRTISDYSFYFVNADTCPLAPSDAMQFGQALYRLLGKIVAADPRFGPVYLSKIDIADGFYRVRLLSATFSNWACCSPSSRANPPWWDSRSSCPWAGSIPRPISAPPRKQWRTSPMPERPPTTTQGRTVCMQFRRLQFPSARRCSLKHRPTSLFHCLQHTSQEAAATTTASLSATQRFTSTTTVRLRRAARAVDDDSKASCSRP